MRTIAGALLLIAAAICLGASVIAEKLPHQSGMNGEGISYLFAMILGPLGFTLLFLGLALDSGADSQPTPRWVWITLLIVVLGVFATIALMIAWPASPHPAADPARNAPQETPMARPAEESRDPTREGR